MQTEVRKLYVTVLQRKPMKQDGEDLAAFKKLIASNAAALEMQASASDGVLQGQQVHVGVTCDGCDKGVEGFRYKCIQCPDYDLCDSCESKGLHAEHYMIRIPVPIFWHREFGKRLAHNLAKVSLKFGAHGEREPEGELLWKYRHGKHHFGKHHGHKLNHGTGYHCGLETLASYMNNSWSNLPCEKAQGKDDSAAGSRSTQQKSQEQQEDARVQHLRNIGQKIAKILDPLGIDVDIEVRTKNKTEKVSKSGDEQKEGKNKEDEVTQMDVDDKQDNNNAAPPKSQKENPELVGSSGVTGDIPQQGAAAAAASSSAETGAVPIPPEASSAPLTTTTQSAPVPPICMYPNMFNMPNQVAFRSTPFHMQLPRIQPLSPYMPPKPLPLPPQPFMNHQPNVFMPRQPTMEPHIADALEKMTSMGFSNDGGWLTQLLESKNGDIEKALDVLQPVTMKKAN
ncbi:sequestosome-1-like isoform X2 [Periplaneta americana]